MKRGLYIIYIIGFLLLTAFALAESYYADITIDLDEAGTATITGRTNHPVLEQQETSAFTSKRGTNWLFNLSLPEEDIFSDYIFSINLPSGGATNYVKSETGFRIQPSGDGISVKGSGQNKNLEVIIQYHIGSAPSELYWVYFIIFPVFLFFAGFMIYFAVLKFKERPKSVALKKAALGHEVYDSRLLTERQKDIMKIIVESQKAVTQAQLCERLSLPKSSVSRNVESLIKKGLIKKERRGMSTFLYLSDIETYEKEHGKTF